MSHRNAASVIKILLLFGSLLLHGPAARAVEPGDAYAGLFGGYQKGIFAPDEQNRYVGLKSSVFQPTLSHGDYRFDAIGFYRNADMEDEDGAELGLVSLFVEDFWLNTAQRLSGFLGDHYYRSGMPSLIFEHFSLPGQTLRGAGGRIDQGPLFAGLQGGRLTEQDFIIPEAVSATGDGLAGGYFGWQAPSGLALSGAVNVIEEESERRFLSAFYMNHPAGDDSLRLAAWHDSQSNSFAAALGVIRAGVNRYFEAGLSHVPEDFNYLSQQAPLPQGQSQLFGTYRYQGVQYGYTLEGSGGTFERQGDSQPFVRGGLNGFYRLKLQHFLSGGINASYLEGSDDSSRWNFRQNLRYSIQRRQWDTSAQLQALQFIEHPGDGGIEENRTLRWIANLYTNYRSDGWQAGADLSLEHTARDRAEDATAVVLKLDGRIQTGLGLDVNGFVQGGVSFAGDARDEVYGFGVDCGLPFLDGYSLRIRARLQRNRFSNDFDLPNVPDFDNAATTLDLFAIVERRYYWGRSSPVYGQYSGFEPIGVGVLTGRVFIDANGNRRFDAGETPLKNVVLRMDDGFVVATQRDGAYRYPNVAAGTHRLSIDEASFAIEYVSPYPEGRTVTVEPRREVFVDWPLQVRAGGLTSRKAN